LRQSQKNRRGFTIVVFLLFALVAVIIGMKRSAILGLSLGYITYFLLTPDKTRLAKSIVSLAIILLISTPIYLDTLTDRYEVRAKRGTFDVQTEELENTEARYREYLMVMNDFERRDIITALFGTEAFNDLYYYRTNRMLHTDFMLLLSSSGVIGLLLHIAILLVIPFELLGIKPKRQSQKKIFKEVYAVNLAHPRLPLYSLHCRNGSFNRNPRLCLNVHGCEYFVSQNPQ
jgi:4-amino-4-deoxy-L-arabinose transferase-like glycosyltransferase